MLTSSRKFGVFIIILAVIILVAVIYFIFIYDFDKGAEPAETTQTTEPQVIIPAGQKTEAELEPVNFTEEDFVQTPAQLAASFIERFGTTSNQAPSNLNELKLFMTTAMADWAAKNMQTGTDYENYYGITTLAVSQEVQSETESAVKILVHTSRTEVKIDQSRTFDQDAVVELIKQGKRWKVDAVRWQ